MVTKRELLNNLSNIYKCKVSPGGTFSLGNFLFDERENYHVYLWHKERKFKFFLRIEREKWPKTGAFARHIHVYLSIGSTPPPGPAHFVLCVVLPPIHTDQPDLSQASGWNNDCMVLETPVNCPVISTVK